MRRILNRENINTLDHWNKAHRCANFPYSGLDSWLTLFYYYRPLLVKLGYPDIFFENSTWLDFGCGNAARRFKILNPPSKIKYVGLDFSNEVIDMNRKADPEHIYLNALNHQKYDLITALHVFEHLENPQKCWNDLWELTSHALVIQVPYKESFVTCDEHIWQFNEDSFETDLAFPVIIIGPKMNLEEDREIFYVWFKNFEVKSKVIIDDLFKEQYSPQGWFLWHNKIGFSEYYTPLWLRIIISIFGRKNLYNLRDYLRKLKRTKNN